MTAPALRLLDGLGYAAALQAGTLAVARACDDLDRINVFPVPDADTGANLTATLRAACARLGLEQPGDLGSATRLAADAALDGARGNSGAIFAQFLHGLAESLRGCDRADTGRFAAGAVAGSTAAWQALQDPQEGTILSVMRAWSACLAGRAQDCDEFGDVLAVALEAARRALADTPLQLAALARRHVVDAGGQGFVCWLEGIAEWLRTGVVPPETEERRAAPVAFAAAHAAFDSSYRFCTEALLSHVSADVPAIKARLAPLGESLVVAGGGPHLRIHLHTNAPQRLFDAAAAFGTVEASKVDDMILQQLAGRHAGTALVADSTCDLPEALAHRFALVRVPLALTIDGQSYRDGVDMTATQYYKKLPLARRLPTSSQPPVGEFRAVYERLLEHHDGVVSLHIAGALSGTVEAARSAAEAVDGRRVRVIDTHKVSIGAGLLIEAAGEAIEAGADLDEIEDRVLVERGRVALFGTISSLDQAVQGGRVSARAARLVKLARLHPIILFDQEGRVVRAGFAAGFSAALRALVRRAAAFAGDRPARLMVVHTDCLEAAETVAQALCRELHVPEIPVTYGGPVIATHVGLGAVTVAVRRLG
jgi:uncharacterized protein